MARDLFADDPGAECVLAVLADPAQPDGSATLLNAATDAVTVGRLVVVTSVPGLGGFCASLHAEHPRLGILLIQTPENPAGLRVARQFADPAPGRFRELRIDEAGNVHEPVMTARTPPADGPFPLGPPDVVLVSGITGIGDLACAGSLTSRGAALAVIAPPGPEDPRMAAYLSGLRASGIRVSRKKADPTDPGQVAAAVRSLERTLGPVTAIVHAAARGSIERCARLPEATLRTQVSAQRARLGNLLAAVAMERVRLLLTLGSVSARYGQPEGACGALLSGLLPGQAARLVSGWPRCRAVHVDSPGWVDLPVADEAGPQAGPGPDLAAFATPIPGPDSWALLHAMLASPGFPATAAIHGRVGAGAGLDTAAVTAGAGRGRFLETIRVHYPRIELVAEARLSLPADPYLADHRIDGLLVLPASVALEAMAQAAGALAGEPLRKVDGFAADAPVVFPPGAEGAVIRVCALRREHGVDVVLRCSETGFRVDHAHAAFHPAPAPLPPEADQPPGGGDPRSAGIVDGTDLYGPVYFQTGRFRRVAFLPEVTSSSLRALVRGGDDQPWFGAVAGPVDVPMLLGSPGLNDATLHVVQACLPHRRVLPAGCESATFTGREVRGALQIRAERRSGPGGPRQGRQRVPVASEAAVPDSAAPPRSAAAPVRGRHARAGADLPGEGRTAGGCSSGEPPTAGRPGTGAPSATQALPAGPGGPDSGAGHGAGADRAADLWDIVAVDATGQPVSAWKGVRMADVGPLAGKAPWHPTLLAVCLERRAAEFGLDPAARAVVSTGRTLPPAGPAGGSVEAAPGGDTPAARRSPASDGLPPLAEPLPGPGAQTTSGSGQAGAGASAPPGPTRPATSWTSRATGRGPLDGFELTVRGSRPIACAWDPVGPPGPGAGHGPAFASLRRRLAEVTREPAAVVAARTHTIATCLTALGLDSSAPFDLDDACDGGWIVVRAAGVTAACAVVDLAGAPAPVAVAIAARAGHSTPDGAPSGSGTVRSR